MCVSPAPQTGLGTDMLGLSMSNPAQSVAIESTACSEDAIYRARTSLGLAHAALMISPPARAAFSAAARYAATSACDRLRGLAMSREENDWTRSERAALLCLAKKRPTLAGTAEGVKAFVSQRR